MKDDTIYRLQFVALLALIIFLIFMCRPKTTEYNYIDAYGDSCTIYIENEDYDTKHLLESHEKLWNDIIELQD